jgi:hypothetical protein
MQSLHSPVTLSLLGPNTPPNPPFSNTLSLRFSLNVNDQVSKQNLPQLILSKLVSTDSFIIRPTIQCKVGLTIGHESPLHFYCDTRNQWRKYTTVLL